MAIGRKVVPAWKLSQRRWMSLFIGTGAWEISGGLRPRCKLAGCKDRNIVGLVRCFNHILWRFCGVWYCDSLQCHEKTKIRSLARHPVFAVLLTSPQGELQRTENPYLSVFDNRVVAQNFPGLNFYELPIRDEPEDGLPADLKPYLTPEEQAAMGDILWRDANKDRRTDHGGQWLPWKIQRNVLNRRPGPGGKESG